MKRPPLVVLGVLVVGVSGAANAATFTIVNDDDRNASLRTAIADANLTPEPDVIVLPAPPDGTPDPVRFDFGAAPETDAVAGAVILPAITSDITIEGAGPGAVILSASGIEATLLVVRTDPSLPIDGGLELPARLTLRNLTLERGLGDAAGAVVVRAEAPPTGEMPALIVDGVTFALNQGAIAGAIHNLGAPLDIDDAVFVDNTSPDGAGAITSVSGGSIATSTFTDNSGRVGAVEAPAATFTNALAEVVPAALSIAASTFTNNQGQVAGGVRSLANTGIANSEFIDNRAEGDAALGGAVQGSNLRVVGGLYDGNLSTQSGGAIAFFVDAEGGPGSVLFADVNNNTALLTGGGIHTQGVALSIADTAVQRNVAGDGGAGAYAASAAVSIERSRFTFNRARPEASFVGVDVTLDELGGDIGLARVQLSGGGSALRFDTGTTYDVGETCFVGNGATAVVVLTGATGTLDDTYWGSATGFGPTGTGDTLALAPGLPAPTFATEPAEICDPPPTPAGDRVDVPMSVRSDSVAQIGVDFRVIRAGTGTTLLVEADGVLGVDARSGVLDIEVGGINDADEEGGESVVLRLNGCQGGIGTCPDFTSAGSPDVGFEILDNGDGVDPGEGEGEGEACVDEIKLSAQALAFEDRGDEASTQKLTVTNTGPCEVRLIAPLVQKGASQGFSVDIVPQAKLLLAPDQKLELNVGFLRPAEDPDAAEAPEGAEDVEVETSGVLVIETAGGVREEVPLTLTPGCGCRSTTGAPPWLALALLFFSARSLARGRRQGR